MSETWPLCGQCFAFCIVPESFELVLSSGECHCPVCKHQAHYDLKGDIGHWAPSNAHDKKRRP